MHEYRFLSEADLPAIYNTFVKAFADYAIQGKHTQEEIRRVLVRRGVCYDLSVGVFEGTDMVAVMATGLGEWSGAVNAYDIFTGVTPQARGRGLAGGMIDYAKPALTERGAQLFVLEVLTQNEPALKAYSRVGMKPAREFQCFKLEPSAMISDKSNRAVRIEARDEPDWDSWLAYWSWESSWQNSPVSLGRAVDRQVCYEARSNGMAVGYAIIEPANADLCQLVVSPHHRRRGIGTRLLEAVARSTETASIRILNIDASSEADLAFYRSCGARDYVRQYEMTLSLDT